MSFNDLQGRRFGYVTVLQRTPYAHTSNHVIWECRCDCGNIVKFNSRQLNEHDYPNCGCLRNMSAPPYPAPEGASWIPLTKGQYTLIDAEDYERVSAYTWTAFPTKGYKQFYASNFHLGRLHRWLLGARRTVHIDHCNRNPLDNRRSNLRVCTRQQNAHNRRLRCDSTSPYKGIHWRSGYWQATILHDSKKVELGRFTDPEEAARAYDEAAMLYFGEFASCNLTEESHRLHVLPGGALTKHAPGSQEYEYEERFASLVLSMENKILDYRRMEQIVYEMRARRGEVTRRGKR